MPPFGLQLSFVSSRPFVCNGFVFFFCSSAFWRGCGGTLFRRKRFPRNNPKTPNEKADLVYKSAFFAWFLIKRPS